MLEILDEEEKLFIKKQSEYFLPDKEKYENGLVFLSALRIINIVLGKEWYQKSDTGFVDEEGKRTIDKTKVHPISKLLGSGESDEIAKLVEFANYIQVLFDNKDFINKLRRYVKDEKYSEITFERFQSLLFELKMACYHKQNGLQVEFVRESNIPSPDLKIIDRENFTFLECKKKKYKERPSISSILDTIIKAHDKQIVPRKTSGIIAIELSLDEIIFQYYRKEIINAIQKKITELPSVNFVEIYNEYVMDDGRGQIFGDSREIVGNPNAKYSISNKMQDVIYFPQRIPYSLPFVSGPKIF